MTFVRRIFSFFAGIAIVAGVLGAIGFQVVFAADTNTNADPTAGYNNIIEKGIIFANMKDENNLCKDKGECSLDQILQVFVNVVTFILGISGSVVLLMFVYGGFMWVTSRGEAKHVQTGKDTVVRAMLGFAIIVLSYSLINFLVAAIVGDKPGATLEDTVGNALDGKSNINTPTPPSTP